MKILTIVYNLEKGGTQRAAQNFCEGYAELGHDSRILATYGAGPRVEELQQKNIHVWVGLDENVLKDIFLWDPDVVHIHSHLLKTEDIYAIKSKISRPIFVETNVFSIPSKYESILQYSYQLSKWCSFLYIARGGSREVSTIVPYPVKTSTFFKSAQQEVTDFRSKLDIPKNAFVFGRIGQDNLNKWSLYIADVFEKFHSNVSDNCYLILVNPPSELIEYVSKKKINNVLIIDKIIGDEELRKCYSSIDLFLHIANIGESFGMVLAESILCETPVITLSTPWADNSQCEVVEHGIGGMCATTINEFYKYMVELYKDDDKRHRLGKSGRENIIKKYNHLVVAQKSIDIVNRTYSDNPDLFILLSIKEAELYSKDISLALLRLKLKFIFLNRPINFVLRLICRFNTLKGKKFRDIYM